MNASQSAGPWNKGDHDLGIGNQTQNLRGRRQWDGILDEARVMQAARSPGWRSAYVGRYLLIQLAVNTVYGTIFGIGLWLSRQASAAAQTVGRLLLRAAPWLMKALSVLGTAAMFLVGGGILVHGIPVLEHFIEPYKGGLTGTLL